ncbi:MAG: glycosyltransferase family 2 protein [Fusobacteriaceae bacterium]
MSEIDITIIIPIYNGEKYIKKCLESITDQSYKNFEIICIDDGSTDRSNPICQEYTETESRMRLVTQKNSGPSSSRNCGIELARGKYLCFVDADDMVEKDYLEKLFEKIEDGYDLVTCGYRDYSQYGRVDLNDFYKKNSSYHQDEFLEAIFTGVGGTLWGKIFKKNLIMEYSIRLNQNIFMCEDQLFVLEYTLVSSKFSSLESILYNYNRLNEKSLSAKIDMNYYKNFKEYINCLEDILVRYRVEKSKIRLIIQSEIEKLIPNMILAIYIKDGKNIDRIRALKTLGEDNLLKKDLDFKNFIIKNLKNKRYLTVHIYFLIKKNIKKTKNFVKFKILRRKNENFETFFRSE